MAIQFADLVGETASNKPTAGGTFNLSGTAITGLNTFVSQITSGNQVVCKAESSAGWMTFLGTFTDAATDTLSVDAVRDSSTGSAIDFSGGDTVNIRLVSDAKYFNDAETTRKDYVSGLKVKWSTATQIKVDPGAAYVEQSSNIVTVATEQTVNPTLSASTWHYVYLKTDGTIEVSTTAPIQFSGLAYSKNTSGQKYRLLGQFRTNASSQIYEFVHYPDSNSWYYPKAGDTTIYRVLSIGQAITSTAVSLAPFVPPISNEAWLKVSNSDTTQSMLVGDGRAMSSSADSFFIVASNVRSSGLFICNSSQQITYYFGATPTNGGFVDILGYVAGR